MTDVPPPPPKSPMIHSGDCRSWGTDDGAGARVYCDVALGLAPPILLRLPFHRLQWEVGLGYPCARRGPGAAAGALDHNEA